MDIIFVKVGKAVDWFENDSSTEEGQNYMFSVVEPFLDLAIDGRTNTKTSRTKLSFKDNAGKQYNVSIGELLKNSGIKVYYEDYGTPPNLTPFIPERVPGLAENLFLEVAEFMYDRQVTLQSQPTGE